jgi:pimeloyl-ACP methyl ester carboxylesterase
MIKGQTQPLAKKFRVLTCDLRNQGETGPLCVDAYTPLSTYVDDLIALLNHTFGPNADVHVVGWSFGAVVALALARCHPSRVKRLVVVEGGYFEPQPNHIGAIYSLESKDEIGCERLFGKDWNWVKDMCSYDELSVEKRCDRMLQHADTRRKDPIHRQGMSPPYKFLHQMYVRSEKMTVMRHGNGKDLGRGALMQETAVFAEGTTNVEDITTPTLIVHGRHDGMHVIARALDLKQRMQDAQMFTVRDQGHVGVVAHASEAISEFLLHSNFPLKGNVVPTELRETLCKKEVLAMLGELVAQFETPVFQSRLRSVLEAAGDDHVRRLQFREKLCREHQYNVIQKYGYERDRVGWLESVVAVGHFKHDPEVSSRQERLTSLLSPNAKNPGHSKDQAKSYISSAGTRKATLFLHLENKENISVDGGIIQAWTEVCEPVQ